MGDGGWRRPMKNANIKLLPNFDFDVFDFELTNLILMTGF